MQKRLFIITGAAGTGKSTVQHYLDERYNMTKVITHTTRTPRKNEKNGIDYYFETQNGFKNNHYLESVQYSGNQYGSSYEGLNKAFNVTPWATIVLDTSGALTYLNKLNCSITILFLHLNSTNELKQRMLTRGDNPEKIERRLNSKEFMRDQKLPPRLKGHVVMIHSEQFKNTERILDKVVASAKANDNVL